MRSILRESVRIDIEKVRDFTFKIADNKKELESAYRLVYDRYVREGYMEPCESKLRLSLHHALPETTTFIGKTRGIVALTLTLFQDSDLSLPMDAIYKKELDGLRDQNRKISEVGSLASQPFFRNRDQNIPMHGFKIMHTYASKHIGVDDLVIAINPKHEWFYKHVLLFERIGGLKPYDYVNKAPAIAYRLNLRTAHERYWKKYANKTDENNLHKFFFEEESLCIELPGKNGIVCVWDSGKIKYFFEERTDLLQNSNKKALNCVKKYCCIYQNMHTPCHPLNLYPASKIKIHRELLDFSR